MRGQVMAATTNKFMSLLRMMDQKAQAMILLNSVMIPLCINSIKTNYFVEASIVSMTTAILSIFAAIVCIYPKRKRYRKGGGRDLNLLHFNDIGHMEKQDFLDQLLPAFNDTSKLAEIVVNDLYDTSRYSILPKYVWLKISYALFFFGNLTAIGVALSGM